MSCFVVVYFLKAITYMYLAFTSKKQVSKGLLTGDQKRTFLLSKRELRLPLVYAKANESHPMHGAVIFRMKGKCTLKERALSRLNLKLDPQSSIIETWDLILESFENRVSRLETWVTVNLLLSGTMGAQNVIRMKKLRFSGHQRAKVGSQGPMG